MGVVEVRKAPNSGEFFVINNKAYELVNAQEGVADSCEFWPIYINEIDDKDEIKKIDFDEVDDYIKKGFILFIFKELT